MIWEFGGGMTFEIATRDCIWGLILEVVYKIELAYSGVNQSLRLIFGHCDHPSICGVKE